MSPATGLEIATMADALYTGCPLPPERGHIRLLRLHASSDTSAPLSGTILATTFEDSPASYEALSYCWGDDTRPETIIVHLESGFSPGEHMPVPIPITHSLAEALADLRLPTSDRLLWTDALCINQADNGEKSIQVRQMYDVYANSRRTLVYLGREGSKGMQAAIAHRDYLRALNKGSGTSADSIQAADPGTLVTWDPAVGVVRAGNGAPARVPGESGCLDYHTVAALPETNDIVLFAHKPDIVASWKCILESPWMTRAWTTQEFVAGPDVLMQLGQRGVSLTLDDLTNLARYTRYDVEQGIHKPSNTRDLAFLAGGPFVAYSPLRDSRAVASKVFRMINFRLRMRVGGPIREGDEAMSVGGVLLFMRGEGLATVLNTRDARDVLWSLLALSRHKAAEELQPNYDLSIDEVYQRFSMHIATAEPGSLCVLLMLPLRMQAGTPSWRLTQALEIFNARRFYYDQKPRRRQGTCVTTNDQGTELTLSGTLVDRIDRLVEPNKHEVFLPTDKAYSALFEVHTAWMNTLEAASWPGLFVLPDESPDEATFHFFRGMTSWVRPGFADIGCHYQPVFNASWEEYAHLWTIARLTCVFHTILTRAGVIPGEPDSIPGGDFLRDGFFDLVRRKGWPMDMVRHYLQLGASEPSGFPAPEDLTTRTACLAAIDKFQVTAASHACPFLEFWRGKTVGMTNRGHLCNVDEEARVGDWLAVTVNEPWPVILRERPGGSYSLVGKAYAHGLLEGMGIHGDVEEEIRLC